MTKRFYDLEQVRDIPILDVAAAFGVDVKRGNKCKIRDEKTPSVQLYTKSRNGFDRFWDFGINEGGDVIVFVSKILNCDWQTALEQLADTFGIEPVNNTEYRNRSDLTNSQYAKIGIFGDLATKNLDFDLERFSMESAQKYADKYKMSVNELRKQYPDFYTHKILMKKALPFVSELRNRYYSELYAHYSLAKLLNVQDPTKLDDKATEKFEALKSEVETAERLLHRAAKGTSMEETLALKKYDVLEDYMGLINGEITFQVGAVSYNNMKLMARKNDEILCYRSLGSEDYFHLSEGPLKEIPHAAFLRAEKVNLAFLPEHSPEITKIIEALQGKDLAHKKASHKTNAVADKKQVRESAGMER